MDKLNKFFILIMFGISFVALNNVARAKEVPYTQEDRDRSIRLEIKLEEMNKRLDERFEQVDKRIVELREDMNKRFEQVDKRFEQMYTFLWILSGIFTTLTVTVIGLLFWDRKTIIGKAKEETIAAIEKEGKLISVLRELSKQDMELSKVLKQFNLL